jgi:hypothetical protein
VVTEKVNAGAVFQLLHLSVGKLSNNNNS